MRLRVLKRVRGSDALIRIRQKGRGGRVVALELLLLLVILLLGISGSRAQSIYSDDFDDGDLSEYGQLGGNWSTVVESGRGFGPAQRTVDISAVIQELVDRPVESDSAQAWRVTGVEVAFEPHPEFSSYSALGDIIEWFPQLTGAWNQEQMLFVTTLMNPFLSHEVRANRLRLTRERLHGIVSALRYRVAGVNEEDMVERLNPIVENYEARLRIDERLISAVLQFDDDELERAAGEYELLAGRDTVWPLIAGLFEHPGLARVLEAGGIDIDKLLDSLLG